MILANIIFSYHKIRHKFEKGASIREKLSASVQSVNYHHICSSYQKLLPVFSCSFDTIITLLLIENEFS